MDIALLASGSSGNAILVRTSEYAFLVDAGLSAREIIARLDAFEISPSELIGIVLTHEHSDHIRGVGPLARRFGLPVWTNRATLEAGREVLGKLPSWTEVTMGIPFKIGNISLEPFSIPHDAADPFGLTLKSTRGYSVGLATDMGFVTQLVRAHLQGLNGLILEFNHDLSMLLEGPYPWPIKQRIRGKLGHLSNKDAATLLGEITTPDLEWVVCAHISQQNNDREIVASEANWALKEQLSMSSSTSIHVATQAEPTPLFGPGGPTHPVDYKVEEWH